MGQSLVRMVETSTPEKLARYAKRVCAFENSSRPSATGMTSRHALGTAPRLNEEQVSTSTNRGTSKIRTPSRSPSPRLTPQVAPEGVIGVVDESNKEALGVDGAAKPSKHANWQRTLGKAVHP